MSGSSFSNSEFKRMLKNHTHSVRERVSSPAVACASHRGCTVSSRFELSLLRVYEVLEYYSLTALLVYPPFQPLDVSFDELRLRSVAAPLMVTLRSSNSSQRLIAPLVRFGTFSSYRGANHSAACMMATVKIASMSSTLLQLVGGGALRCYPISGAILP